MEKEQFNNLIDRLNANDHLEASNIVSNSLKKVLESSINNLETKLKTKWVGTKGVSVDKK